MPEPTDPNLKIIWELEHKHGVVDTSLLAKILEYINDACIYRAKKKRANDLYKAKKNSKATQGRFDF